MTRTPEQQKSLNDSITLGVSSDDADMVRLGLEKGGDANLYITTASSRGSIARQSEELLVLALKKGADANLMLFAGVGAKALYVAKIALEQGGADVNCTHAPPGKSEECPVAEWSYRNFDTEMSDYLFKKGLNVDAQSKDGTASLLRALKDKDYEKTMHYLGHGANPFVANAKGEFPLRRAQDIEYEYRLELYEKRAEVVRAMLKNVPEESADNDGSSPSTPFNTVATANDVAVNHPLELKRPADQPAGRPPEKPAKGFSL